MNFPTPETGLTASLKPADTAGASTLVSAASAAGRDFADAFAALPHAKKQVQDLGEQTPLPSDAVEQEADSDLAFQDEPNKEPVSSPHVDVETVNQSETAKPFQSAAEKLQRADISEPPAPAAREPQSASEILHGLSRQQPAKMDASVPAQQSPMESRLPAENSGQSVPHLIATPTRAVEQAHSTRETNARPPTFATATAEPRTDTPVASGAHTQNTASPTPPATKVAAFATKQPTEADLTTVDAQPVSPDGRRPANLRELDVPITSPKTSTGFANNSPTPKDTTPSLQSSPQATTETTPTVRSTSAPQSASVPADQRPPTGLPLLDTAVETAGTANKVAFVPQNRETNALPTTIPPHSSEGITRQSIEVPAQIEGATIPPKDRPVGLPLLDTAVETAGTAKKVAFVPQNRETNALLTTIPPHSSEGITRQSIEVPAQIEGATIPPKDRPAAQPVSPAMQTLPQANQPVAATSKEQTVQTQQMQPASSEQSTQASTASSVQVGVAVPLPAQARTTPRNQSTQQTVDAPRTTKTNPNASKAVTAQSVLATPNASQAGLSTQQKANVEQAISLLAPSDAGDVLNWDAARQLTPQVGPHQPLRADIAPQIARQMAEAMPLAAQRPVEIALSPEELGRVRMSISTDDGSITVNILAERPETLDLMRRHIDQLGLTFRSMGYEQITFAFGQGADTNDQGAEGDGKQNSNNTGATSSDELAAALPPSETLTPLHTGAAGVDIRM